MEQSEFEKLEIKPGQEILVLLTNGDKENGVYNGYDAKVKSFSFTKGALNNGNIYLKDVESVYKRPQL
jgi:hypothetical protein